MEKSNVPRKHRNSDLKGYALARVKYFLHFLQEEKNVRFWRLKVVTLRLSPSSVISTLHCSENLLGSRGTWFCTLTAKYLKFQEERVNFIARLPSTTFFLVTIGQFWGPPFALRVVGVLEIVCLASFFDGL